MSLVDLLGWGASLLLVASMMQKDLRRLRLWSLGACAVWIVYGILMSAWPVVATNLLLTGVNLWHLLTAGGTAPREAAEASRVEVAS